jgi:hypothetical protein
MSSDEYDGNRSPRAPKLSLKIKAVDARQANIQNETAGTISCTLSPKLFCVSNSLEWSPADLRSPRIDAYSGVVVDYVDSWNTNKCHSRPMGNLPVMLSEREQRSHQDITRNSLFGMLPFRLILRRCYREFREVWYATDARSLNLMLPEDGK